MFKDRRDAGRQLAERLTPYAGLEPVIVGLARGGVPVAAEVATRLGAPLDLVVVRKLGCPWQPELGIGAIAERDVRVLNEPLIAELGVTPADLERLTARELAELRRRVRSYRRDRPVIVLRDRAVILVDDGLATGYTARAAIEYARRSGVRRAITAVPVASEDGIASLRDASDDLVVASASPWFFAIGECYEDFRQTTDDEIVELLDRAAARMRTVPSPTTSGVRAPA